MEGKLTKIQNELKVPKGRFNEFSKFNYRNCEDILEAVKPLLDKYNCSLTVQDYVEEIGGRVYVRAVAIIVDNDDHEKIVKTQAYAREPESKKGMDDSQLTGSTSSYARKYALSGLFLLDDGIDADSQDNTQVKTQVKAHKQPSKFMIDFDRIREHCAMIDDLDSLTDYYNQITAGNPTDKQLAQIKKIFSERKNKL